MLTLTATDLPRFIGCNGSVFLEPSPSIESDSTLRREGVAAHWLVEQVIKFHQPLPGMLNKIAPNGILVDTGMIDDVTPYIDAIWCHGDVEVDTSYTHASGKYAIGGRADHLEYVGGILTVSELKYGYRIVEPVYNYTLLWHAVSYFLRAKAEGKVLRQSDLQQINLRIYQPRQYHPAGNIRTWTISANDLNAIWKSMETMLEAPVAQVHTGSHCYRCPAMTNCPAYRKARGAALEQSEQAFTDKLNNEQLSLQLAETSRALTILKAINTAYEELATYRLQQGEVVPDYALDKPLGKRKWKPNTTPEFLKMMTGKDLSKPELVTPAQAEKMGISKTLVDSFAMREPTDTKLVRAEADAQARKMFNK